MTDAMGLRKWWEAWANAAQLQGYYASTGRISDAKKVWHWCGDDGGAREWVKRSGRLMQCTWAHTGCYGVTGTGMANTAGFRRHSGLGDLYKSTPWDGVMSQHALKVHLVVDPGW